MLVSVVANCQSHPLCRMIAEARPDWDVADFAVHADDITKDRARYHDRIRRSDIILMQPIHDGYRNEPDHCSSWIRSNARNDAIVLTFPSLYYWADHPTQTVLHAQGETINVEQGGGYLFGLFAIFALAGVSKDRAIAWLLAPDAIPAAVLDIERESTIRTQRERETADQIDLTITPFYEQQAGTRQLFHLINHPTRAVLADLLRQFFKRIESPAVVQDDGEDYFNWHHFPPLPAMARYYDRESGGRTQQDDAARQMVTYAQHRYTLLDHLAASAVAVYRRDEAFLRAALRNQSLVGILADNFQRVCGISVAEAARSRS